MSRKIKFRVYSNCYKKYLDTSGEGIFCEVHHLALKPDGKLYYADIGIEYPGTLSECPTLEWKEDYDDCVVEQYTGSKDRNGKEIYEGDILDTPGGRCKVVWSDGGWGYQFKVHRTDWFDIVKDFHDKSEVIGNIHENPELLEGVE